MIVKTKPIDQTVAQYEAMLEHKDYYAGKIANLKPESRRMIEVLAVRCLIKELLGEEKKLVYDQYGAPRFADDSRQLSISHTDGYVAVAIDDKPVGIDIERRGRRVERVCSKFLQPSEEALVSGQDDPLLAMHLIWSAKEAVFKFLGHNYFDLQNLTCVIDFDFNQKIMLMEVERMKKIQTIHFDYNEDYVLCYSTLD